MNSHSALRLSRVASWLMSVAVLVASQVQGQTRLLRYPDLHGDQIVFTYAGDLWISSTSGGAARRLTTHPGVELFAKFSPDGRSVAFTGQYDGDEQVYVVPAVGGAPRQLTYYPAAGPLPPRWGYDNQVYGWHPDGDAVLFRSMREGWDLGDTQLFVVPVDGGMPQALPMPESGGGAFSPDGRRVAYSPVTRDFRHWKRYQGGWAQDLYLFDLETLDVEQITDDPRSDRDPMWFGETVYYSSDRSGRLELYAYDTASGRTSRLGPDGARWDVRWPSLDESSGRIVYEQGGQLEILDPGSAGRAAPVSITVPTDALETRPRRVDVGDQIRGVDLSPKGERAVFSARGELFSAPIEHGPTRNLTRSSDAHDREPAWSPDGRTIAYVSDADGEEEIWLVDHQGRKPARQLTDGSQGRYYDLAWSPDSSHLAYRDQRQRLFVVEVSSGQVTEVADHRGVFGLSYEWAPGGGWLALSLVEDNGFQSIHLWRQSDGTLHRVTDALWNEFSPSFDPKGDYLYFVADRMFQPQTGSFEFNYLVDRESYVYAVALRDDVEHLFPPRADTVTVAAEDEGEGQDEVEDEGDQGDEGEPAGEDSQDRPEADQPTRIDLDGIAGRVMRFPLEADNYFGVVGLEGRVMVVRSGASYYGRSSDRPTFLLLYDLEERKLEDFAEAGRVAISADRTKAVIGRGTRYALYDIEPEAKAKPVKTDGLAMNVDPVAEWRQIYDEVWRRFRDFFYAPNMHGYDWAALQETYEPLLEHVGHRSDLNYVLAELIAELNVSHAYVAGGDFEIPERPQAGLLGARFELDGDAYRLGRIFAGQNEEPVYRSPLTEVGVGVEVGDYLFEINGEPLTASVNPFALLRNAGGAPVELLVGETSDRAKARYVLVEPVASEDQLIYLDWVQSNRRRVSEASEGRLGYIHIPDMGAAGIREWIKWFYGQQRKEGLVIDVRNNGGGNVSQMIIERLRRKLLMVDFERNSELDDPYPSDTFIGHLVCLIDEDTASDGDQFAYVFRQAGLGPLIGKRTWGGVVGIYGRGPLIDGGSVSVPEAGSGDADGNWVIEGHGVDPDVEIENHPRDLIGGTDAQLEKGIEILLGKIVDEPRRFPRRPPDPVKLN